MAEPESRTKRAPDQTSQGEQMSGDNGFRNLVQENYPPIFRFALANLQDSEIAKRATERTLVSALLDIQHPRSGGETKLWLYTLALKAF